MLKHKRTDEFETKVKRINVTIISEDLTGELIILEEFYRKVTKDCEEGESNKTSHTIPNNHFLCVNIYNPHKLCPSKTPHTL